MSTWEKFHADPVTLATVVIAAATVVNLIVSGLIWSATRNAAKIAEASFKAGNRAYIGLAGANIKIDSNKRFLDYEFVVKNFGNVPTKAVIRWSLYLDGKHQPGTHDPSPEATLFPGSMKHLLGGARAELFDSLMSGATKLDIHLYASYKGIDGENYEYCENNFYDPSANQFSPGGACSADEFKPTK